MKRLKEQPTVVATNMAVALCALAILVPTQAIAQKSGWVKVDAGNMLMLTPVENEWQPIAARQEVPLRTYVVTTPDADATLFRDTDAFELPSGAYFYLEDVLPRPGISIVEALTRIEIEQLPDPEGDDAERPRQIGLRYGRPVNTNAHADVPNRIERMRAVSWFAENERHDSALLSLKRMMTKYPQLYGEPHVVERLLSLYDTLDLYGFLLDESERLLNNDATEAYSRIVIEWNERAKGKLER